MISLEALRMRYDPFPIGIVRNFIRTELYEDLLDTYPPPEAFIEADNIGRKYTLSEKYNPREYHQWIRTHEAWQSFHDYVKSPDFVVDILDRLLERGIDLGIRYEWSAVKKALFRLRAMAVGGSGLKAARLRPRFEFSALPAQGGSVVPHTDNASKVVTIVVPMVREGEWDPEWGGSTECSRPVDTSRLFNRRNFQLGFEEVKEVVSFPFESNQAILFVKTFNSWHCVRPMTSPDPFAYRRTLTINIEIPD
ncbi:MAG: hypothetical protein ACPGVZ_02210 [Myxococcota bacterium]